MTALWPAEIGALPRHIKFRNALPDEGLKFLVAHLAELVYMGEFDPLVRPCRIFDRRSHNPRFAGRIEAEQNRARGPDRAAFAVDHGVNGHDERAILLPLFRFLPIPTGDMRKFFTLLELSWDVRLG